jgi:hypothetical protein
MEGVNKSNSIVDRERLDWMNGLHIRHAMTSSRESRAKLVDYTMRHLQVCLGLVE